MGSNHKINQIHGLFIITGGFIGLLFYLLYPFEFSYESQRDILDISIMFSVVFMALGTFFFIFAKKLPTLRRSPLLTIILCIAATFELIAFFINPLDLGLMLVLSLIFWATALPHIWLIFKKT